MDMTEAPFSNLHVREALYYASDRAAMTRATGNGVAKVASTVNEPEIYVGSLPSPQVKSLYSQIKTFPFNLAKAKQQLAMSPWPHGFKITLNVPEEDQSASLMGQVLQSDWAKIGVTLKLHLMPPGPRFQVILNHGPNLGLQFVGNVPDARDPVEMPWEYFSSQQAVHYGNNSSNLRVPAIDGMISRAQGAISLATSATDSIQAEIAASKYVPIIPVDWVDEVLNSAQGLDDARSGAFLDRDVLDGEHQGLALF